jgi:hypothetical protein
MGGRRPTPAHLKHLRGNPGRRPLKAQPVIEFIPPPPPDYLSGRALAEWLRLGPILKDAHLVSPLDSNALASLCIAVAQLGDAQEALDRDGATYATPTGFVRASPHLAIAHRAMKLIAQISAEFGLTPAARTRVQVEISTEPDEFEMFLANGRKLGR